MNEADLIFIDDHTAEYTCCRCGERLLMPADETAASSAYCPTPPMRPYGAASRHCMAARTSAQAA